MKRVAVKKLFRSNLKKALSIILTIIVLITSVRLDELVVMAEESISYITLYLIDNTSESWVGNDDAVIELVDNTFGHDRYMMTKVNSTTWSVNVPESAYNITFNRYNHNKTIQWNSWSAGGRDSNNAYYVDGSEYGHWEVVKESEDYFHAGDIVYLDLTEFKDWGKDNALMYINFTRASKAENNGNDININNADKSLYNPKRLYSRINENVYKYIVTEEDEGATYLRFWRGNEYTLWNCSIELSYEKYKNGDNCIKIKGWDRIGEVCEKLKIITIDENGLLLDTEGYTLSSEFIKFSGKLSRADEVDKFYVQIFDKNQNMIYREEIEISENWSLNKTALIYGYNKIIFEASIGNQIDTEEIVVFCNTSSFFDNLDVDLEDTDKDGLLNYLENYFGTDPELEDTDGDGLSDFAELYYFGYNPLEIDTDQNGISDYDEDIDSDTLSNGYEIMIGSNPIDDDSDNDFLNDNLEIEFGTSPLIIDTDENGISDYEEYKISISAWKYDEKTGIYEGEFCANQMGIVYDETVVPTVKIFGDSKSLSSFNIKMVDDNYLFNPAMKGYIGTAYEFETEGTIEYAELTFTYNENLIDANILNSEDFCPTIYYFNVETNMLEELPEQSWVGNQISVKISHFSTYLLINKTEIEKLWNRTFEADGNMITNKEIVFVLDKSGSMISNDPNYIRTSLVEEFFNKINESDKIGLVGFSYSATNYTNGLTNDHKILEEALQTFQNQKDNGGTYMNSGIEMAVTMLRNSETNEYTGKYIFVLTDGYTSDTLSSEYLSELRNEGIKIYTVGLGNVSTNYLTKIAQSTNGEYFYAKTSSDLSEVFIEFEEDINDYDLNRDGLNDEITKLICEGKITTITGTQVFCLDLYDEIMKSDDYDGDGLKNGEEIKIFYFREIPYIWYCSSPEIIDTDCDGYSDYEEVKELYTQPLTYNYVISSIDRLYVNNINNFEAGKAFNEYLESSTFNVVTERVIDVLFCGGEISLSKAVRKELVDYFVVYAQNNEDNMSCVAYIDVLNNYLRGAIDLLPELTGIQIGIKRIELTNKINKIQAEILSLRNVPYSKATKNILKTKIKNFNSFFSNYSDDIAKRAEKISKYGTYAGVFLAITACTLKNIEEATEYYAAIEILRDYEDVLYKLKYCGNSDIESAAKHVIKDMNNIYSKYKTGLEDSMSNIFSYGWAVGSSYYITSALGIPGLIIDLVALAGSIVAGNSFSTRLKNCMSNDLSIAISLSTSKIINDGEIKKDSKGNMNIILKGKDISIEANKMWLSTIFSKYWCESKYLAYLEDDGWFMDDDYFLYKSPNSKKNAVDNINKLTELYGKYCKR